MRTKDEMMKRARGVAEEHFYCDDECEVVWKPFENHPKEWVAFEVDALAEIVFEAMVWVQEGTLT